MHITALCDNPSCWYKQYLFGNNQYNSKHIYIGLLFKFVDFLYSRSELFDRVIKVISSENIFFSPFFMYKV